MGFINLFLCFGIPFCLLKKKHKSYKNPKFVRDNKGFNPCVTFEVRGREKTEQLPQGVTNGERANEEVHGTANLFST